MIDLTTIFQEVSVLIRRAGQKTLFFYGGNLKIRDKGGDSPVTQADIESEKIILAGLKPFGYLILSEESTDDKTRLNADRVWIVDPLDGTKDFIKETSEFTIMIGLVEKDRPILGLVYQPVTDTLYYAIKGQGAFVKNKNKIAEQIRVSNRSDFKNITMFSSRFHHTEIEDELAKKLGITKIILRGSSLKVCQIAAGEGELNLNPSGHMSEWDLCAADIILHEAGGKLTDMHGDKILYNKENVKLKHGHVASNGRIHEEVIEKLNKVIQLHDKY